MRRENAARNNILITDAKARTSACAREGTKITFIIRIHRVHTLGSQLTPPSRSTAGVCTIILGLRRELVSRLFENIYRKTKHLERRFSVAHRVCV